ncbi:cytochrome P450 [Micromonospora sp. LOL_024]|uniref:cytochrome P450 n=1 Tax=Micromonospora sp. LOL_024 TaxID=3345412 RepID=UPI003A8610B7
MTGPVALPTTRRCPFDPPPRLGELRAEQPIRPLAYPDGAVGWLVTGYRLVRTVLADPRFSTRAELKRVPVHRPSTEPFYGRPALPGWFVDMDAPKHTRFRRLLSSRFGERQIARLRPRIEEIVAGGLDALAAADRPADLVEMFALPIPSLVICELLGVPYAERSRFQKNSITLFSLTASVTETEQALQGLNDHLGDLVRRRRAKPAGDLLSVMANDSDLADEEIVGAGVLLLTAGHETVASMIGLGTFALLSHNGQRRKLAEDLSLIDTAVEELLRYLTIFHFGVPRTALVDIELEGVQIRVGECLTLSLPAANRDPETFAEPDRLDITRRATGHLAFGYGTHKCIGQSLARLQLRIAYPALIARFPGLRLAVPAADVPMADDMGFYGVHHLPVTW